WPSCCRARILSSEWRQTARSGPPCPSLSVWASPTSPNRRTSAPATRPFGTPPLETLTDATVPIRLLSNPPIVFVHLRFLGYEKTNRNPAIAALESRAELHPYLAR